MGVLVHDSFFDVFASIYWQQDHIPQKGRYYSDDEQQSKVIQAQKLRK